MATRWAAAAQRVTSILLEVEPPGPTDRSELGLLSDVLRARSQQWSCGLSVGPEVYVDPADLAVEVPVDPPQVAAGGENEQRQGRGDQLDAEHRPIPWAAAGRDRLAFTKDDVLFRVDDDGDLFAPLLAPERPRLP